MMKLKKNEEGYALLLVLFLVVFIMSITAVFMRGAISNAKQKQIIDKNNLSFVAAEIGVEYYETAITNDYYNKLDVFVKEAFAEVPMKDDKTEYYKAIREKVASKMEVYLEVRRGELLKPDKELDNIIRAYKFSLEDLQFDSKMPTNYIIFDGVVIGEKNDLENPEKSIMKRLEYKQAFLIPSFDPDLTGGSGNGGGDNLLPPPKPVLNLDDYQNVLSKGIPCRGVKTISGEICETIKVEKIEKKSAVYVKGVLDAKHEVNVNTNSKLYINGAFNGEHKLEVANSAVYVGGVLTATNHILVKTNSNLYITGALNGTKLKVDKSTVYVEGVFTATNDVAVKTGSYLYVKGALNGMGLEVDNSTVYAGGAVTVKNHTMVNNNSVLYVTGALNAKKKLDVDNSTVYVGGALSAGHDLMVKSSSNVCVAGALSVTGSISIDSNSKVYVIGAAAYKSINKAENLIVVAGLEELNKACGGNANAKVDTTPAPTIDVTY